MSEQTNLRPDQKGTGAKRYLPAVGIDYATTDLPYYDYDYPPMHFPHFFVSQGRPVQSFMWLANGKEAKGCVILSPQAYGGDSLDSVVPTLLGAGINVLRFNPRGMWDNESTYSFPGAVDDLHAAVAFLRSNNGHHVVPGSDRTFQIDGTRIAVLGKSGGGGAVGWVGAAENPDLNVAIAVSPGRTDMHRPPYSDEYANWMNSIRDGSAGRIDLLGWLSSMTPAEFDRLSMTDAAPKLIDKRLLLIGSSDREYVEDTHKPIVASLEAVHAKYFSEVILEADEYFLTKRIALARLIVSWLKSECGF